MGPEIGTKYCPDAKSPSGILVGLGARNENHPKFVAIGPGVEKLRPEPPTRVAERADSHDGGWRT